MAEARALLAITGIAYRRNVPLHLLDEFGDVGKKPLFAHVPKVPYPQLASVDRVLEIAQPRFHGTPATVELGVGSDRNEGRIIAAVVARRRGIDAVFGNQLRRDGDVGRWEPQRVTAPGTKLHQSANLVTGAAQQPIRASEISISNEAANARARNVLALFTNAIDRNDPDAAPRQILAHEGGIAGAAVTEAERIADDYAANSKRSNQKLEKGSGRQRGDTLVKRHEKAFVKASAGEKAEPFLLRANHRGFGPGAQMCCRMICEG